MTSFFVFGGLLGVWVAWAFRRAKAHDTAQSDLELPTWSEADECRADEDLETARIAWQQSVELPMARPLSAEGVLAFRRDLKRPVRLTQAEAEHVMTVLFPRSRRTPKEVA